MFDRMLISDKILKAEQMKEADEKMARDGMSQEQWDAQTPEQQEAALERV